MFVVPIVLGSHKDLTFASKISAYLSKYDNVQPVIRICSAHKAPKTLLSMIHAYDENESVKVYVTIAGKSNALSALIDGNSLKPVISCPPLKHESMYDIYSSISMPSEIAPMVVINPVNAALAVLKILGTHDSRFVDIVRAVHENNRVKLNVEDTKNKYAFMSSDEYDSYMWKRDLPYESLGHLIKKGKIRDLYTVRKSPSTEFSETECLALVATSRLSGFDRSLCEIKNRGVVLNRVSTWWFEKTKSFVPNHLLYSVGNTSIVQKCRVFPIEFVMRGYMTGSTNTSIWMNYQKGVREFCGHTLRDGYVKNQKLDSVILTPTTKDEHDENISEKEIIERNIMSEEDWNTCKKYAHSLFEFGQLTAAKKGLILVDTKYEFGINPRGQIVLIDEVHTPDSSRYWIQHSYQERFNAGKSPENIDKEFIRRWVKETYKDPYDLNINIEIPDSLKLELGKKYLILEDLITN